MATTTTNFGWDIPQSTDLVKDGATAIAALGQDIDTALVDLKGGTTGQVLAKASASDLDFTWVAQDDSNAIQNALVDAKGDLISATGADTPARLAVGSNGQILTADSTASTGLKWATPSASGLSLVTAQTFTATNTINFNNCFSSSYENYRVLITGNTSTNTSILLRMRTSGTNNTTNSYETRVTGATNPNTGWQVITSSTASSSILAADFNFYQPFTTHFPRHTFQSIGLNSGVDVSVSSGAGIFGASVAPYDGFAMILSAGTFTGTIRVYGWSN